MWELISGLSNLLTVAFMWLLWVWVKDLQLEQENQALDIEYLKDQNERQL